MLSFCSSTVFEKPWSDPALLGLTERRLSCDDDRLTVSARGGDEEATRLSIAVALEDGWR